MIYEEKCVRAKCDNCGEIFEDSGSGFSIFMDAGLIEEEMNNDDWYTTGSDPLYPDNHFCPACFKWSKDEDDKIIVDISRKKSFTTKTKEL